LLKLLNKCAAFLLGVRVKKPFRMGGKTNKGHIKKIFHFIWKIGKTRTGSTRTKIQGGYRQIHHHMHVCIALIENCKSFAKENASAKSVWANPSEPPPLPSAFPLAHLPLSTLRRR